MTDAEHGFTFVELFAGIGGFRIGLEKVRGRCLYSSEWDKYSAQTYRAWHGEDNTHMPQTTDKPEVINKKYDFRNVDHSTIPVHDVLTAGFPCQPFSLAGVSKKNWLGQPHGFDDTHQGNLFEHIMNLLDKMGSERPPVLFLENVKNLLSHDGGNTWKEIKRQLYIRDYELFFKVIDAAAWVPQHRERVYMVCFDQKVFGYNEKEIGFEFPDPPDNRPVLNDILEPDADKRTYRLSKELWASHKRRKEDNRKRNKFIDTYMRKHRRHLKNRPDSTDIPKCRRFIDTYLRDHTSLLDRAKKYKYVDASVLGAMDDAVKDVLKALRGKGSAGASTPVDFSTLDDAVKKAVPKKRGFGYGWAEADGQTRTLSARYHKDGAEILYKQPGWQRPRRLTPTECGRLMGFDEKYVEGQVVSNSRAYMQYGNAVVPPVIAAIGREIAKVLASRPHSTRTAA